MIKFLIVWGMLGIIGISLLINIKTKSKEDEIQKQKIIQTIKIYFTQTHGFIFILVFICFYIISPMFIIAHISSKIRNKKNE